MGAAAVAAGRVRVAIIFADGHQLAVQYYVHPDAKDHVEHYTTALSDKQFYTEANDAFSRSPSYLNFDRRLHGNQGGVILQNNLAWIAGLSDECGAGPAVAMAIKNLYAPTRAGVEELEMYVHGTLWGTDSSRAALRTVQDGSYGVRASMFYSGLSGFNYTVAPCWDKVRSQTRWRSYNYPHVTIVYWSLYRIARNYPNLNLTQTPWLWYMQQAANTTIIGLQKQGTFSQFGLMAGSCWIELLHDLRAEATATTTTTGAAGATPPEWAGWASQAADELEAFMRSRVGQSQTIAPLPFSKRSNI